MIRNKGIWLGGVLMVGIGLMHYLQAPGKGPQSQKIVMTEMPSSSSNAVNKPHSDQRTLPQTGLGPVKHYRRPFASEEDQHFAADNACGQRCVDAGILAQSLLAELCSMDMPLEQALKSPLYGRLLIMFTLHAKAEEQFDEVEAELRENVDCVDQATWGGNTHRALLLRGIMGERVSGEMEMMINDLPRR